MMNSPVRFLAALLALLALTVSMAAGLWAEPCPSSVSGVTAAVAPGHASTMFRPCSNSTAGVAAQHSSGTSDRAPTMPHCPLAPMGASGSSCAGLVALASHPFSGVRAPIAAMTPLPPHDDLRPLLLADEFFHPPRA